MSCRRLFSLALAAALLHRLRAQGPVPTIGAQTPSQSATPGEWIDVSAQIDFGTGDSIDALAGPSALVEVIADGKIVEYFRLTAFADQGLSGYPVLYGSHKDTGGTGGTTGYAEFSPLAGTVHVHTIVQVPVTGNVTYSFRIVTENQIFTSDEANSSVRLVTKRKGVVGTIRPTLFSSASGLGSSGVRPQVTGVGLKNPKGVAIDASGTIYVADTGNSVIRMITPNGAVSTLAGTIGVAGGIDGTGPAARFISPTGIVVDANGIVYVSDVATNTIRKITPAGVVTTLAGTALQGGSADGTGSAARFYYPYALVLDAAGNLLVGDSLNETIRKVTPAGVVTTIAGAAGKPGSADGPVATARFNFPCALAYDSAGNLFVADDINNTVRKITPAGIVSTFAGTAGVTGSADGTGAAAQFNYPFGLAIDYQDNLYVSDDQNNTLRKITPAGVVTTLAGSAAGAGSADGTGATARFNNPYAVAIGPVAIETAPITLTVSPTAPTPGRLINLSIRSTAGAGGSPLTCGFVVGGSGTKNVLVRGIGPALTQFGVPGALPDPTLTLFSSGSGNAVVGSNAGWGGSAALAQAFSQTGAFALPAGSLDSALLSPLSPGSYTAQVGSTAKSSGVALAEVYDTDSFTAPARLVNLSALAPAGVGAAVLTAGFVVTGPNPETLLIRGVGPGLVQFGVPGVLPNPQLSLHTSVNGQDTVLDVNLGWQDSPSLGAVARHVGAFAFPAGSADSSMLVTLSPGVYTAQVLDANNVTGTALLEIYEVAP